MLASTYIQQLIGVAASCLLEAASATYPAAYQLHRHALCLLCSETWLRKFPESDVVDDEPRLSSPVAMTTLFVTPHLVNPSAGGLDNLLQQPGLPW